jgi:hypothetical protein
VGRRRPLLVCGDVGGNGGELQWTDFILADRDVARDSDPSSLVTALTQAGTLFSATYTQTGTARDGFREGRLLQWDPPAAYQADERDIFVTEIYDVTWAASDSKAIISAGLVSGDTLGSATGFLPGLMDNSIANITNVRTTEISGVTGNVVARAGIRSVGRIAHARANFGSANKLFGFIGNGVISDAGSDGQAAYSTTVLAAPAAVRPSLMIGSIGTGTATGTVTFRARYAHIRLPAFS